MIRKTLFLALALAAVNVPLSVEAKPMSSNRFIQGSVAKENINRVNSSIHWNTSLNQALDQARRENKMVLWVQMIGQMSGST
ncbi:MAG: hypothetical protein SGJ27_10845 [Candidatus Melainabacteria bacterium]|nr:hypothetical protein [Candidatus Melainabacteria bacterium]